MHGIKLEIALQSCKNDLLPTVTFLKKIWCNLYPNERDFVRGGPNDMIFWTLSHLLRQVSVLNSIEITSGSWLAQVPPTREGSAQFRMPGPAAPGGFGAPSKNAGGHGRGDSSSRQPLVDTVQWTNISHLGMRKIIFKSALVVEMLVPRRVEIDIAITI